MYVDDIITFYDTNVYEGGPSYDEYTIEINSDLAEGSFSVDTNNFSSNEVNGVVQWTNDSEPVTLGDDDSSAFPGDDTSNPGSMDEMYDINIRQEANLTIGMTAVDQIEWTDGKNYTFNTEEGYAQGVPDMFVIMDDTLPYPDVVCSDEYDDCGAIVEFVDGDTGEVLCTEEETNMLQNEGTLVNASCDLFEPFNDSGEGAMMWDEVYEMSPDPYTNVVANVEIYAVKEGTEEVQGRMNNINIIDEVPSKDDISEKNMDDTIVFESDWDISKHVF